LTSDLLIEKQRQSEILSMNNLQFLSGKPGSWRENLLQARLLAMNVEDAMPATLLKLGSRLAVIARTPTDLVLVDGSLANFSESNDPVTGSALCESQLHGATYVVDAGSPQVEVGAGAADLRHAVEYSGLCGRGG
jgi:hypothetical protein